MRLRTIFAFEFFLMMLLHGCASRNAELQLQGDSIVKKVENFRQENGRLPDDLEELGIESDEAGPIYYRRKDSLQYEVWFGSDLGESVIWDPAEQKWK